MERPAIVKQIENQSIKSIGKIEAENFNWPTTREDALKVLRHFCDKLLIHFGDYQDALHTQEKYLFHSRLSFALNTKMLSPQEVIDKAVDAYYANAEKIAISQIFRKA